MKNLLSYLRLFTQTLWRRWYMFLTPNLSVPTTSWLMTDELHYILSWNICISDSYPQDATKLANRILLVWKECVVVLVSYFHIFCYNINNWWLEIEIWLNTNVFIILIKIYWLMQQISQGNIIISGNILLISHASMPCGILAYNGITHM